MMGKQQNTLSQLLTIQRKQEERTEHGKCFLFEVIHPKGDKGLQTYKTTDMI